jgi:putative DNA primase/helicase
MHDRKSELIKLAKQVATARFQQASVLQDSNQRNAGFRFAQQTASKRGIDAFLALARAEPAIADDGDSWNADPLALGVANGIVDLRSGEFRPRRQEDLITLTVGTSFDSKARCPRWERFIEEVFQGDAELMKLIQCAVGYTLTGLTSEQVLFLLLGNGENGKSVFLNVLHGLFGDYAGNLAFTALEENRRQSGLFDMAPLVDKRLVTASETNEGARLNSARVKVLTGGDPVTASFKYKNPFEFVPAATLWLAMNYLPQIHDDSHAMWRRIRLVPFNRRFSGGDRDDRLTAKILDELPGILNWAIEGCLLWQRHGLPPAAAVQKATSEYREESDLLQGFIANCCQEVAGGSVPSGEAWRRYSQWCDEVDIPLQSRLTQNAFGRRMRSRYDGPKGREGIRLYHGIVLKDEGALADSGASSNNPFSRVTTPEISNQGSIMRPGESSEGAAPRHSEAVPTPRRGAPRPEATGVATPCTVRHCTRPSVDGVPCFRHRE